MALERFHPAVQHWFTRTFADATAPQRDGWAAIAGGEHTLIAAPTGSGKTLAAFLWAIDQLVRESQNGELPSETRVVYVSPLKALSTDVERNLQRPIAGVRHALEQLGLPDVALSSAVRTGDTPARDRAKMLRSPPHLFVTTPESLYLLLTSEGGRKVLRTAQTVIVDEIHALVGNRRGAHLALSLERLDALAGRRLQRIGLSATQKPIESVASFLVGATNARRTMVDATSTRDFDLSIEVPRSPLEAVMSMETWDEIYDRLTTLALEHRTTLVFVNTRRLAERIARKLAERLGEEQVAAHHGSLARDRRLAAERRLKDGSLRALVATASLELGIDIGNVDLVCQIGSSRSLAALIQRVGRSRHHVGGVPKGRIFPTSRDDLVECAALLRAVRHGELDHTRIPNAPLDVLAQQVVAACASEAWSEDDLFTLVRQAYPYRDLERASFDGVIAMLADGYHIRGGRRSAYLHHDRVNGMVRGRKGARLTALTSGGAIPDTADYAVTIDTDGTVVGTVHEDFAIESMAGDIFQLGNTSWQIVKVDAGRVRVRDAQGQPPTIPFWIGEAPGRTDELSRAVAAVRADLSNEVERVEQATDVAATEFGLDVEASRQLVEYLATSKAALGVLPTQEDVVLERFFDEVGGMQLVLHAPLGSRINRAWGLALRKRFCQRFNFELQAAASDDAIVLSLGPTHSFPLEDVFHYLHSSSVRDVLIQAMLVAPMFAVRWRWNASRALAVPRFRSGKKVAPQLQRMQSDDLMALLFPDQVACAENLAGPREIPEHPLVVQTIDDCLTEAMDIEGLERILQAIEDGTIRTHARDLTEPSPMAQEILNARPYAFLDDAPLEERRTQAVMARRWLDPAKASDLGALDLEAIERVRREAWPACSDPETLHDGLMQLGIAHPHELSGPDGTSFFDPAWLATLRNGGRIVPVTVAGRSMWTATERAAEIRAALSPYGAAEIEALPAPFDTHAGTAESALVELVRDTLACHGPTTVEFLAQRLGLASEVLPAPLAALEAEGSVLRGRFTPGEASEEWCERGLLARIHRYTLGRLRREISPVAPQDFQRFLQRWQHVEPEYRLEGPAGLAEVLRQLEGFEAPAATWEADLLPVRLEDHQRAALDALCLSGQVTWLRLTPPAGPAVNPIRSTPISFVAREHVHHWADHETPSASLGAFAAAVHAALLQHGACFHRDLSRITGLLGSQLDEGLGELVARGMVSSDSFAGMRALLTPDRERGSWRNPLHGTMETAGRWSLVTRLELCDSDRETSEESVARTLLRRYGVVMPRILVRERRAPPWRRLIRVFRRLEARGEIRGGRFVEGCSGEHFALPEAVEMLREIRRSPPSEQLVALSTADPLCLSGILDGHHRLPPRRKDRVLYRDGALVAVRTGGHVEWLAEMEPAPKWRGQTMLERYARFRNAAAHG